MSTQKLLVTVFSFVAFNLSIANSDTAISFGDNGIKEQIQNMVQYPEFAKSNSTGNTVTIKFQVANNGTINVLQTRGSENLGTYIEERLNGQYLNVSETEKNKVYQIDLNFKLI